MHKIIIVFWKASNQNWTNKAHFASLIHKETKTFCWKSILKRSLVCGSIKIKSFYTLDIQLNILYFDYKHFVAINQICNFVPTKVIFTTQTVFSSGKSAIVAYFLNHTNFIWILNEERKKKTQTHKKLMVDAKVIYCRTNCKLHLVCCNWWLCVSIESSFGIHVSFNETLVWSGHSNNTFE